MAPSIAKNYEIYIDGYDLACALKDMTWQKQTGEVDVTALCTSGNRSFKPGSKEGTLNFSGFFDYDAVDLNEIENVLEAAFDDQEDVVVSASRGAVSVGGVAVMVRGGQNEHNIEASEGEAVATSGVIRAKGNIYHGKWVYKGSVDDNIDEGDSVDNGAATTNGGVFHGHTYLESDSDATDGEFLVEHSTNNTDWDDLIPTTAIGAENGAIIVEIPAETTIRRYTRTSFTAVGGKAYAVGALHRF